MIRQRPSFYLVVMMASLGYLSCKKKSSEAPAKKAPAMKTVAKKAAAKKKAS